MSLFNLMGLISTIVLLLPLLFIFINRLGWYRTFPALVLSYLLTVSYNFSTLGYIHYNTDVKFYHGVINNILDAPLMLIFLFYFCRTPVIRKRNRIILLTFIAFEAVALLIYGVNRQSIILISGVGILFVLIASLLFFIHQIKITVIYHKAAGKALIISSILFAYIGFSYVYCVYYFLNKTFQKDAQIVFFLITIMSSLSLAVGVFLERRRVQALIELKTTREELKLVYANQERKTTAPFDAIVFNFDKKQWN